MPQAQPKFRRRKADRPGEIVAAAMAVFAEKGFAAAKLDEIAARAGVSKGAIYLYFAAKEDIFQAVVEQAVGPNVAMIRTAAAAHPGPFSDLVRAIAVHIGAVAAETRLGGVAKIVIGEARNFPQIARIWHDQLAGPTLEALGTAIAAAQARGEVREGDPRTYAMQLMSPLVVSVLWLETFVPVGAPAFDIPAVMRQHAETYLRGVAPESRP